MHAKVGGSRLKEMALTMTTTASFLVEESPLIRENLIPAMEALGGARVVAFAETEQAALTWLKVHPSEWNLTVVDVFLKDGSGLGLVAKLRDRRSIQRVAVLTNYATDAVRRECADLGADAVFDKSTELDAFFEFCRGEAS
jgi:ActR/RegA family two-component response regulator